MSHAVQSQSLGKETNRSSRLFWPLAITLATAAYFVVMSVTFSAGFLSELCQTLANILPLVLLGAAARQIVRRRLIHRTLTVQVSAHAGLAVAFALLWYWALMVLLGLTKGSFTAFDVRPLFSNPALAWQLLQGLTVYALIAALTHLEAQRRIESAVVEDKQLPAIEPAQAPSRFFIKLKDELRPIDIREIVSISGAGDYAEVTMVDGKHLTRMTLAEFEAALKHERFIRVHRCAIVNLDRVLSAEPAGGGGLVLHMDNGDSIRASKAGAKRVRQLVI